jgi:magnesium transporter
MGPHRKAGLPPGTLLHIGEVKTTETKIRIIDYDEKDYQETEVQAIDDCFSYIDNPTVTWINIDGLHEPTVIERLGNRLGIHPLVLEDILHTGQRPKMEDFEGYLFVVLKMLQYDEKLNQIIGEQISLIVGPNYVISFQEREGDIFNPIRDRIKNGKGRIKRAGADYLAYALLDTVVDHYFVILEALGEEIESLEDKLVIHPTPETLQTIHKLKAEMIFLRKSVWPLREVVSGLERGDSPLVAESTRIYLRDVYDHTIQVIETIETFRDMVTGMLDIYLSSISNRMNEVMKVLTIIATIFIPLTFVAGIYGMNFKFMPELEWHWGYPAALGVMVAIAMVMFIYFRGKKWL